MCKHTIYKKVKIANGLMDTGYTFHQIAKAVQMDIRTVKKVLSMSLSEQEKYLMSTMNISHTHKKFQKEKRIYEIRKLYKQGNSAQSIARQLGLDRRTISKYLNPKTTGVHASLGQTKMSMLDPYAEEIKQYVPLFRLVSFFGRKATKALPLLCAIIFPN
ncbi:helix-turn-helix domain-containing protein [Bacillus cereus]|uniref:helix-turn-helix domain-containing protein n=1 Tax=Bacillus cereus TaxID=1396 RepID=UPI000BEBB393|nr:helix-turn-helix domain-containing protein [Bacillus cereus]PEF62584.1 hypothetical protein CON35_20315 [Bacillus cereus]